MLPTICEHARIAFGSEPRERRDELIADVVANAFVTYTRLLERGKEDIIYVTPLAMFAIKHVRCGRTVGCKRNVNDVLSRYAQRANRITVDSLHRYNPGKAEWKELLIEDRKAGPAETAASRIDFSTWLKTLTNRQRHIAETLAAGETTTATTKPLPAREPMLPGESLTSFLRRNSAAMSYGSLQPLLSLLSEATDRPLNIDQLSSAGVLDQLAELTKQSSDLLSAGTVHTYAQQLVFVPRSHASARTCDPQTITKYFRRSRPPICSRCVREDPVAYERLLWSFRPIPACLAHGCILLAECPACQRNLRWLRIDVRRCPCGYDLSSAAAPQLATPARTLLNHVAHWLAGRSRPLPEMSTAALFWWLQQLAAVVRKMPTWIEKVRTQFNLPALHTTELVTWLAAAQIVHGWPEQLETFLDQLHQQRRSGTTGVSRSLGPLLRHAAWLEEQGFTTSADTLRQYLLERDTTGVLSTNVCLFRLPQHQQLLQRRPWLTLTEATRALGLRQGAIALLVENNVLAGRVEVTGRRGRYRGIVSRPSVESFQQRR